MRTGECTNQCSVLQDPSEHIDLAETRLDIAKEMYNKMLLVRFVSFRFVSFHFDSVLWHHHLPLLTP